MIKPIILDLGSVDLAAGGSTTPIQICFNYDWSILPIVTGTSGNADYTLKVSHINDLATFKDYKDASTGVSVDDAIQDDYLAWTWIYVEVNSGGGSSGTVQFSMELKHNG